jgi:hypothetical protein
MKNHMSYFEKQDLLTQASANRDVEWEEQEEELNRQLRDGVIEGKVYWDWLGENPRPSEEIARQTKERRRLKRKSKKNVKSRIEVIDRDALRDMEMKETVIEWSSDFEEGSLVETRDGDIGMVLKQHDPTHNRVRKPKHIKAAMMGSYVRLLVNGVEEWHTKLSVSALEDN